MLGFALPSASAYRRSPLSASPTSFEPLDPDYQDRVRDSFERQTYMAFIGAEMTALEPGRCRIKLAYRPELCQQHGFFHGAVTGAIADSAAGYAAFSLMPADASILTVEYKINLVAPAEGERLIARAEVQKAGKTLTVVGAEVFALRDGEERLCAISQSTMMCLPGRRDGPAEGKR